MGELEKLINQTSTPATSATSATQEPKSSKSSESSRGAVFNFDSDRTARAIQRRKEARQERLKPALGLMKKYPGRRYYMASTTDCGHYVIVSLIIAGEASCELSIPKEEYDGFKLLEILDNLRPGGDP